MPTLPTDSWGCFVEEHNFLSATDDCPAQNQYLKRRRTNITVRQPLFRASLYVTFYNQWFLTSTFLKLTSNLKFNFFSLLPLHIFKFLHSCIGLTINRMFTFNSSTFDFDKRKEEKMAERRQKTQDVSCILLYKCHNHKNIYAIYIHPNKQNTTYVQITFYKNRTQLF